MAHWAEDDMEYEDEYDGDEDDGDSEMDEMGYPIGSRVLSSDFGCVEVEDEEHGRWLRQRESEEVVKECERCERPRRMHRDYSICGSCADRLERGEDF